MCVIVINLFGISTANLLRIFDVFILGFIL